MGGGGSTHSSTQTTETRLSNEQADILHQRESQYQQYFFPELISMLSDTKGDTLKTPVMAQQTSTINQQSSQSKGSFLQAMAQRGLSGSGTEARGLVSLENTRGQTLSNAYFQAQQANTAQKNTVMQMAGAMSPTPTTAAPVGSEGSSSGWDMKIL